MFLASPMNWVSTGKMSVDEMTSFLVFSGLHGATEESAGVKIIKLFTLHHSHLG
jgi:hypothetical protein